jgi:cytochrome P450/NADPH-cytochrome P450 reductase
VAAGSGLAPFRGFVQERAELINKGRTQLAPAMLFFGCRGRAVDDLYREEFDAFQKMGAVDDLYREEFDAFQKMGAVDVRRAFSRSTDDLEEAKGCRHVQDRVWLDRAEVKTLWDQGARVYVCGSRAVGEGVKLAMGRIVLGEGASEEEVAEWYEGVRNERYATDVFD